MSRQPQQRRILPPTQCTATCVYLSVLFCCKNKKKKRVFLEINFVKKKEETNKVEKKKLLTQRENRSPCGEQMDRQIEISTLNLLPPTSGRYDTQQVFSGSTFRLELIRESAHHTCFWDLNENVKKSTFWQN